MEQLSKFLQCVKNDPELFKKTDFNFILGLGSTQIKDLKKYSIQQSLIKDQKHLLYLTPKGEKYLKNNPIVPWNNESYSNRPNINLEYLKLEKTPPIVTKAIRNLAKHLLTNEELKENSIEDFIKKEMIKSNKCAELKKEFETFLLKDEKIKIIDLFNKFEPAPYGLTKSVIAILLLDILSKNIDKLAIYEKGQFNLQLDYLTFDRMYYCPQNFEIQLTIFPKNPLLKEMSKYLLNKKTNNILDITKGLYKFIKSLDKYTISTQRLDKKTLRFKNIVLNAKDPISLFYRDIPKVLCSKTLDECDKTLVDNFKFSLDALKNAKNNLSSELLSYTLSVFNNTTRQKLKQRFLDVAQYINNDELKILSKNITDDTNNETIWIDRIATFINKSRVPKDWNDLDIADFKLKLKNLAIEFLTIESSAGDVDINFNKNLNNLLNKILKLTKNEKNILLRKVINA